MGSKWEGWGIECNRWWCNGRCHCPRRSRQLGKMDWRHTLKVDSKSWETYYIRIVYTTSNRMRYALLMTWGATYWIKILSFTCAVQELEPVRHTETNFEVSTDKRIRFCDKISCKVLRYSFAESLSRAHTAIVHRRSNTERKRIH